jgi:hypothetical protein
LMSRSAYETEWTICQEAWSDLLYDAGQPRSTPYSRSALQSVAAKLEYGPNGFGAPYESIATDGCVDGFLHLLRTNRAAALARG